MRSKHFGRNMDFLLRYLKKIGLKLEHEQIEFMKQYCKSGCDKKRKSNRSNEVV